MEKYNLIEKSNPSHQTLKFNNIILRLLEVKEQKSIKESSASSVGYCQR
jgi:hypothetical protein